MKRGPVVLLVDAFDSGGVCDCQCGVRDPDCDDVIAYVEGCGFGEICGGSGPSSRRLVQPAEVTSVRAKSSPMYSSGSRAIRDVA